MKKSISIALAFALLLSSFLGFQTTTVYADDSVLIEKEIQLKGSSWGQKHQFVSLGQVPLDYHWLTTDCKTIYNSKLAQFASILSTDIYENTSCLIDGEEEGSDKKTLLEAYGFEEVKWIDVPERNVAEDENDMTSFLIGHRILSVEEAKYDVYVVVIRGTDGSSSEWNSNMDIGCDDPIYLDKTGEHSDWKNRENHKGFDVASNRVKEAVEYYMRACEQDEAALKSILFTGHSRGAAIANVLGAEFEGGEISSCAYTFSTPNTTTASDTARNSVFNVVNEDDFVSAMPLSEWGFCRYGTDIKIKISSDTELMKKLEEIEQADYSYGQRDIITAVFSQIVTSRSAMYDWSGDACEYNLPGSISDAKKVAKTYGLSSYVTFETVDGVDKVRICPAAISVCISNLIGTATNDSTASALIMMLQLSKLVPVDDIIGEFFSGVTAALAKYGSTIMTPHDTLCTYLISQTVEYTEPEFGGHQLTHSAAAEDEIMDYYSCTKCNRYFSDANAQHEITKDSLKKQDENLFESVVVQEIKNKFPWIAAGIIGVCVIVVLLVIMIVRKRAKR